MSRYMLIMRSTPEAEAAMEELNIDFNEIIESMGRFNEELVKAGVLLAGEGLTGPEEGFVVDFNADPPVVTDGPYTEAKELFNGFWILDVSSKEEAKQWAKKVPLGKGVKLEVRRVHETEEFPAGQPVDQEGNPVEGRTGREDRRTGAGRRRQVRCADFSPKRRLPGADPDGSAPGRVRIDDVVALGDDDLAGLREVSRDIASLVHEVAPVVLVDGSGGVGRADALGTARVRGSFAGSPHAGAAQSRHSGSPDTRPLKPFL